MRVTNTMIVNNLMGYINNNMQRLDRFQGQLATGKKINVPSDDPVVAARALKLRTDVSEIDQYKKNCSDATSWLETTEDALGKINDVLQRIRELTVQAASGTYSAEDTEKIKQEVVQLKDQLIILSNSTYAGRYIFSGHKTDKKLINDDGTFAFDIDSSEAITFEIGISDNININVIGSELFHQQNSAVSGAKAKMFEDLDNLITALSGTDKTVISNMISDIDNNLNNLLKVRSDVGARLNRLELTNNRLESSKVNFTNLMSLNEDVDMAEVIMKLKNEENVYKASLSGGARVIQVSLVDFLR